MTLAAHAQTTSPVSVYLTKGDQSALLEQQADANFSTTFIDNNTVVSIDDTQTYQSVVGFGWTLTQGSAKAIRSMNQTDQDALLEELFHPSNGIRSSLIRISLGASDLSEFAYTYNEVAYGDTDEDLSEFSLAGPDQTDLIPILKKIVAINPNVRLLATPWTAPTWMKVENNSDWGGDPSSANRYIGGRLNTDHYDEYADYFVKYMEAMEAEGLTIWGITPQNEPLNKHNEPSMLMNGDEQLNFVENHLGPKLNNAGFDKVQIIAYDHNCDNTGFPIKVMASEHADGGAFHLYAGDISAMSTVHDATGKDVYFTEQWVSSSGDFGGDFGWHMKNIVVGSLRNWSRSVLEWNLSAFSDDTPRTPGGCVSCLGAVTINDNKSVQRNVAYYIIGQISKFVTEGATRIASKNLRGVDGLHHVAFTNTDGSKVALIFNEKNTSQTFTLQWGNQFLEVAIPANSAKTLTWTGTTSSVGVESVSLDKSTLNTFPDMETQLTASITPFYASNQNLSWDTNNANVTVVDGLVTGKQTGSSTVTVTTEDGNFTDACNVTVQEITTHVTSVVLDYDNYVAHVGEVETMGVQVNPSNATNPALNWISSDENILEVNENGKITPKAAGTVTLTATAWDGGLSDISNITVLDVPINTLAFLDCRASGGLRLEADGSTKPLLTETIINTDNVKWIITPAPTNGYFYIDCRTHDNKRLSTNGGDLPVLVPSTTTGNSVEWKFTESSTDGYYHIDSREEYGGMNRLSKKSLTAAGIADNTITNDATKWKLTNAPSDTSVALTDMTLSPEATTINLNATEQLSLTFTPSNATNQNVTWSSDNDA
ncbi:Ig-like domain-containing protein, partial [Tamlana sp. I1]|uniref:Ig-like domain-containing protein n=1 Tax=Tamlana sp. I1 TaxID=2762061 RepID=UPI00188FDA77